MFLVVLFSLVIVILVQSLNLSLSRRFRAAYQRHATEKDDNFFYAWME